MTSAPLGRARFAAWIAIAVTATYLLLFGGTLNFLAWPGGRIVLQIVLVIAGAAGLLLAARRPEVLRSPVVVAGAIFVVAGVVSAVASQRPAMSSEAAALLILSAPCYLAIRVIAWDVPMASRIRWVIVVMAGLVLLPYIVQVWSAWFAWWGAIGLSLPPLRPGLVGGVAGNPNAMATYTYLLVPYAVWASWPSRRGRVIAVLLVVGALFTLVTTGSRGAWVGAAAGIATFAVLAVADRGRSSAIPRSRLLLTALAGVVLAVTLSPWLITRLAAGDASRFELWAAALSIFTRFPLTGGGPATWQALRLSEPITDPHTVSLLTPHDSVLYVAAEMGLIGLMAAGALLAAIALVAWRGYIRGDHGRRLEMAVIVGSLVALGVHSLFDPGFHLAAVMLLTAFLVARLDGPIVAARRAVAAARWPIIATATAMVIAALTLVRVDAGMLAAEAGVRALDEGRWTTALESFDRAASVQDLGTYELGRAIALSRLGQIPRAIEALERQSATDPLTSASASLATLVERADPERALALAKAVDGAGAYDPTATLNAAAVLDRQGDPAAIDMISDTLMAAPFLMLDPLPAGPVSAATWRSGIDQAIERLQVADPLAAANLALEAGDADRARRLAATAQPGDRTLFEMYAASLDGSPADMESARQAVRASQSGHAMVWFARLATMEGSTHDVDLASVLSRTTGSGSPFGTTSVDVADDPRQLRVARLPTYPTAFSYRVGPQRPYVAGMTTLVYDAWQPPQR